MRRAKLLLLRHAEAAPVRPGERDRERQLTPQGRIDAEEIGSMLKARGLLPDVAMTSDARRAAETMRLVLDRCDHLAMEMILPELYGAEVSDLLAAARRAGGTARTVLIVGHNPAIEGFACSMARQGNAGATSRLVSGYSPAALAVFDVHLSTWTDFHPTHAELRLFLLPGRR